MGSSTRCVTVIGPESTGGRFVCEWLNNHVDIEARHWSMPHGPDRRWPCVDGSYDFFDWPPEFVVVTTRSWVPTTLSQQMHHMTTDVFDGPIVNLQLAYRKIFFWLGSNVFELPFHVVHYERLVKNPKVEMSSVFNRMELNYIEPPRPVVDGDVKWIERFS